MKFKPFEVEAVCHAVSYTGLGIANTKDGKVYVKGFYPGEKAIIEISYKRNGVYRGKIKKLLTISPDRIPSKCDVQTSCGGCVFQSLNYLAQGKIKENILHQQLLYNAGLDIPVQPIVLMKDSYYYRNKVQVPFQNKRGKLIYGFYREDSHDIVESKGCVIQPKSAKTILDTIKNIFQTLGLTAYDEETGEGLLRHVLIRFSEAAHQTMAVLVLNSLNFPLKNQLTSQLSSQLKDITTLLYNLNNKKTNVVLGDKNELILGPGYITDNLLGLEFKISPFSFFQTNHEITEKLYSALIDNLELTKDDVVFDAYCGTGTIGLCLSSHVKDVFGAEINPSSINDALENTKRNNIDNYHPILGDAFEVYRKLKEEGHAFSCIVCDPPRKGLSEEFLSFLKQEMPAKIGYVSCNPLTLGRDLNILKEDYDIKTVIPFDMFPFTSSLETLCVLTKKN